MKNRIFAIGYMTICMISPQSWGQQATDASTAQTASTASWEGLWVAERHFDAQIEGALTLQKSGDTWVAQAQGDRVPASREMAADGAIRWSFSFFDQGYFEGYQLSEDTPIIGHWVQPPGPVKYSELATPVRLEPVGENSFDGTITPHQERYTLNIPLIPEETSEGAKRYRTFLRNLERNTGIYFPIESATIEGDEIRFADGDGEVIGIGQITEPGERFTLFHRGSLFEFTRGSRQASPGFYPRRLPAPVDSLLQPLETGDGWSTATLGETGLEEEAIIDLFNTLAALEPTELRKAYLHSLLVAHRGKLIIEEYYHGHHRNMTHDSRSAGKTIGSALLGMAIYQGALKDVDQPVYPMFGGVDAFANPDPRKDRMTVRHLVSMSTGLACNDGDEASPGHEDNMQNQDEQPDWYKFALDLPMVNEPGEAGFYCTAGINLVGGVVANATGVSLTRFFQESFADPLQLPHYVMNLSPSRRAYMGGGMQLRPRDFLKLGQLYLNGGVWNGQRLISEDWVDQSFAAHSSLGDPDDYGLGWWRYTAEIDGRMIDTYSASGNGGQILMVVPELELTIMMNAGNYSDAASRNALRYHIMWRTIVPAAIAAQAN